MCQHCSDFRHGESNGITRRQSLDFLAAGGLAALLNALPKRSVAAPAADDVVRIGYLPITDATALLVAHAKGFFQDEGLKVEKPTLLRGWAPLVESFAAGKFNLVHLLKPVPIWMRYNNHFPVKIMAWAHTNGSAIVVGGQSDIHGFGDLGGKQIAVPFWYSMHNIILQMALRQAEITPVIRSQDSPIAQNECNLQILQPPDMPTALAARKIDGYIVAEPFNAMGEIGLNARVLRFTGDMWKNHPCCVLCMHEADTVERPEWTQKILNAVVRAEIYASQNRTEVATLLSRDGAGYLPMPAPVVNRALSLYADNSDYLKDGAIQHPGWKNDRIDFQPWPYPSATEMIVQAMAKTLVDGDKVFLDKLDPAFVARDLVNYDFIRNALQRYPDGKSAASDPYARQEVLAL